MKIKLVLFCAALFLVGIHPSYAATSLSDFVEFTGEAASDTLGQAVASGDINGDGYQDLVIGAADNHLNSAGAVYLIYGQSSTLSAGSVSSYVEFTGEGSGDEAGFTVATGDVNNDGYDDIVVGAPYYNYGSTLDVGAVYVMYGSNTQLTSTSLSNYDAIFVGEASEDYVGYALSTGDVNNDDYDDILIGAPINDDGGTNAGSVYLVYGDVGYLWSPLSAYIEFTGEATSDQAGRSLATGDVNGDGYDDILIGAPDNNTGGSNAGATYLIYGKSSDFSSGSLSTRTKFWGADSGDSAGDALATGDVNNDGYADMLIGAPDSNYSGAADSGTTYLIYGRSEVFSSSALSSRIQFVGETASDNSGESVTTGDINNDGYADILIGAPSSSSSEAGTTYLIFGKPATFATASLSSRIQFTGEAADDAAGWALAVGDINNDSYADAIIGAPSNDDAASGAGATYLGYLFIDADGDGTPGLVGIFNGSDCNDADSTVATDQTYYYDADGDGLGSDTTTSACSATAPPYYVTNSNDANDSDYDNDGVSASSDCSDTNPAISTKQTYYQDSDGDGLGSDVSVNVCTISTPTGYVTNSNDQDDTTYNVGYDYDGDGVASTSDCDDTNSAVSTTQTYYRDADGDGYGTSATTVTVCRSTTPTGYASNSSDTNDSDYDNDGTSATSDCNDANSSIAAAETYYQDSDGDGLGNIAETTSSCSNAPPSGYVINSGDDDDTTATGDTDNDDDGVDTTSDCNDADANANAYQTYYRDGDGDGLGNANITTSACSATPPTGYVVNSSDDDDTVASTDTDYDDDGVDATSDCNDADATVSEDQTYYQDSDGDGYGNPNVPTSVCSATAPTGYVENALDTDDTDSTATILGISSVTGTTNGDILVTYEDDSYIEFDVFTVTTSKETIANVVPDTSLIVAVHPKARTIALVDGSTGAVLSQKTLNGKAHSKVKLLVKDLRSDDKYEAVVVAKRGTKTVHIDLFSIKVTALKLKLRDAAVVKHKHIVPNKTKAKNKHIQLRRQNGKVVQDYTVSKNYKLK